MLLPAGQDADKVREIVLDRFDMSLGTGLGKMQGKVFRIGHLGDFNDLTLAGNTVRRGNGAIARRRADRDEKGFPRRLNT